MSKITQYSRISHHTIAGSASAGLTFSVPAQEDFTDGSWTPYDLALSEIGVNEQDEKVYIRIDDEIKEFAFIGASGVGFTGGSGSCITDFYTQNIFACDGQVINLRTADTISTFVDNISDGWQFTINAGYNNISLDARTDPYTWGNSIILNPSIGGAIEINSTNQVTSIVGSTNLLPTQVETKVFDAASTYQTQILSTTHSTLIDTQDFLAQKQGKLEVDRDFIYFGHFDGIANEISYIQAQNDTISIQTQSPGTSSSTNIISIDSSSIKPISIETTSNIGSKCTIETRIDDTTDEPGISILTEDNTSTIFSIINLGNQSIGLSSQDATNTSNIGLTSNGWQTIINTTIVNYGGGIGNTTGLSTTTIAIIDFSGTLIDKVITVNANVNGIDPTSNNAYGSKLFAVFKNIAGTVTQISTTDKIEKTNFITSTSNITISGTNVIIEVTGEIGANINWNTNYSYQISD